MSKNILELITPGDWIRDGNFVYALHTPNGKSARNRFYITFQKDNTRDSNVTIEEMEANAKCAVKIPEMVDLLTRLSEDLNRADYPENSWMGKYNTEINALLNELNK